LYLDALDKLSYFGYASKNKARVNCVAPGPPWTPLQSCRQAAERSRRVRCRHTDEKARATRRDRSGLCL